MIVLTGHTPTVTSVETFVLSVFVRFSSRRALISFSIHMSHALSGTVEAARQGATLSGADVTVIDSGFTDQAMKFQVVEAAKLAKEGADLDTVLARIEEVKEKTELYIGVSTLENLVKGGRIGRVTGLLSSLLNIRVGDGNEGPSVGTNRQGPWKQDL